MSKERIKYLREKMLNVSHSKYRVRKPLTILDGIVDKKPVVIRKALAFDLIIKEMPIFIQDRELIVGSRTMFLPREKDTKFWDDGVKRNLDFVPDAETLNVETPGFEFYPHYASEEEKELGRKISIGEGYVTSHCTAGYRKIINNGFGGIKEQARNRLREVAPDSDQSYFLEAVVICMDAATNLIERYEKLAQQLEIQSNNKERKKELKTITRICNRIKTQPAETFYEALQLLWFSHVLILIENYNLMALGRLDQYLYSFYKKDISCGTISKEQAMELLACLFIKMNDTSDLHTDNGQNIILSGLNRNGSDGTNDLTYLILDAYEAVRLTDPQINLRYHEGTPVKLIERVIDIGRFGPNPMIYNDKVVIEAMQRIDVKMEDARDYCIDACQDLMISEKSDFYPIFAGIYGIHLLTILERVVDRLSDFSCFEEFWRALKNEMSADIKEYVEKANRADALIPKISPTPFLSATLEGCIEKGKDKTEGGPVYNFTGFIGGGLVNVANSVAAIKKIVFEKQLCSTKAIVEAIQSDFDGDDYIRNILKNKAPKFGNNDNFVDEIAVKLADHFCSEVNKYKNPRGGRFVAGLFSHHQARLGKAVRSTPDGRKRGEPLAVSLSPSNGTEKKGPTGAILSASKIDQIKCPLGTSLDLTFYGPFMQDMEERKKITSLIRTYMDMGGIEFQANFLDRETLIKAQKYPDRYSDLVVRVWGFNAYFVTLKPEYQEEIIARTEY